MLLLCATGIVAILVGCGSGDGSSADPGAIETSSISKQQFVEEADAICSRGNRWMLKQLTAYVADRKAKGSKQSEAELFSGAMKAVGLPRVQAAIRDIQSLGAPSGDEVQLEAFLTQLQQETDALVDQPQVSMESAFVDGFRGSGELARDYGIKACAYG